MKLESNTIFSFGKYKGKRIDFVIQLYPDYIYWIFETFNYLEIHPYFLKYATELNPEFEINNDNFKNYMSGVRNFIKNYDGDNEEILNDFFISENYLKKAYLTNKQRQDAFTTIRQKQEEVLAEMRRLRIESRNEQV